MENWTTVLIDDSDKPIARIAGHLTVSDGAVIRADGTWWKVAGMLVDLESRRTIVEVSAAPEWKIKQYDAAAAVDNA